MKDGDKGHVTREPEQYLSANIARLIEYARPELPPDFPKGRGYVLISNHPSPVAAAAEDFR